MKAWETLLFQDEDALAGTRQKGGAAAAPRSAANYQRIINRFRHASIKRQIGPANKREVFELGLVSTGLGSFYWTQDETKA